MLGLFLLLKVKYNLNNLLYLDISFPLLRKSMFIPSSINTTAVLKTIEILGVSYVKLSEQYKKKLESESKNLNFPYRSDTVSIFK